METDASHLIDPGVPFSDADIASIESVLGRSLPVEYVAFVRRYGGAFVGGLVDGDQALAIDTFFAARGKSGILSTVSWQTDLSDAGIMPIADCLLGNTFVLMPDDSIGYIDYYGDHSDTQRIAESFAELVSRIVVPADQDSENPESDP